MSDCAIAGQWQFVHSQIWSESPCGLAVLVVTRLTSPGRHTLSPSNDTSMPHFLLPWGAFPGAAVAFAMPSGPWVQIVVPYGCGPGSVLELSDPGAAAPPVAAVVGAPPAYGAAAPPAYAPPPAAYAAPPPPAGAEAFNEFNDAPAPPKRQRTLSNAEGDHSFIPGGKRSGAAAAPEDDCVVTGSRSAEARDAELMRDAITIEDSDEEEGAQPTSAGTLEDHLKELRSFLDDDGFDVSVALKWCEGNGAGKLYEIVEADMVDDFVASFALKPVKAGVLAKKLREFRRGN